MFCIFGIKFFDELKFRKGEEVTPYSPVTMPLSIIIISFSFYELKAQHHASANSQVPYHMTLPYNLCQMTAHIFTTFTTTISILTKATTLEAQLERGHVVQL